MTIKRLKIKRYRVAWRVLDAGYVGHGDHLYHLAIVEEYCRVMNNETREVSIRHWPEQVSWLHALWYQIKSWPISVTP